MTDDNKDKPAAEPVITTDKGHRLRVTDIRSSDGFSRKPKSPPEQEPEPPEYDEDDPPAFVPGR